MMLATNCCWVIDYCYRIDLTSFISEQNYISGHADSSYVHRRGPTHNNGVTGSEISSTNQQIYIHG
jgi:hypothetical protein